MKRTVALAATVVTALAATGLAIGKGLDGSANARAVSGTFTATIASRVETRTCTTTDGKTLVTTNGMYTGNAAGDADLTGAATLRARSTINMTDDIGDRLGDAQDRRRGPAATPRRSSTRSTAAARSPASPSGTRTLPRRGSSRTSPPASAARAASPAGRSARDRGRRSRRARPGQVPGPTAPVKQKSEAHGTGQRRVVVPRSPSQGSPARYRATLQGKVAKLSDRRAGPRSTARS